MAIQTDVRSIFYYGLKIDSLNRVIDFKEGIIVRKAIIPIGSYTGIKLANEIKKSMDAVGDNVYTVTFNRVNRKLTISSTVVFQLLTFSGINIGTSAFATMGFNTLADKTGSIAYDSDVAIGYAYTTQFPLQSHKPTKNNRKAIDGQINKSSSGVIEVVKFGNERFLSFENAYITNNTFPPGSIILNNPTGVEEFIQFMEWATEKYLLEIMIDSEKPNEFQTFILESTETDPKGLDFELVELYDRGYPDCFRSGVLKFRLME
jgi:hypothetical protein